MNLNTTHSSNEGLAGIGVALMFVSLILILIFYIIAKKIYKKSDQPFPVIVRDVEPVGGMELPPTPYENHRSPSPASFST